MKKLFGYIFLFLFIFLFSSAVYAKSDKGMIAVIGAMDCETDEIQENMTGKTVKKIAGVEVIKGKLGKYSVVLAQSGVGKVNAAITTQIIIDKYKPSYIINTGLAGSLDDNLTLGEIIIADKMIQHDFDVSAFGYAKGYMSTGVDKDKPTVYVSNDSLVEIYKNKLQNSKEVNVGLIASGDVFVADKNKKEAIKSEFGADAVDMESAAVAQTANKNNVPLVVIKTISDNKDEDVQDYSMNEVDYAVKSAKLLVQILKGEK